MRASRRVISFCLIYSSSLLIIEEKSEIQKENQSTKNIALREILCNLCEH